MIVLAAVFRGQAFGSGIFLTRLLGRLDTNFFGVIFCRLRSPGWDVF
jgi:hypothetical protein